MTPPLFVLENLTLGYQRHPAVHHLSGSIARGELLVIAGPNGAGKSTLLKALAGRVAPLSGRLTRAPARCAYLPQLIDFEPGFPIRVDDFVALGLSAPLWPPSARRALRRKVGEALAQVGLGGLEDRPIATLSGGQLQRARLARLIAHDADLMLLDEPLTGLDDAMIETICVLMRGWCRAGRTVVAVLHELELARGLADTVLLLAREAIAWGESGAVLSADNLARAARLEQAWDARAPVCHREQAA